MLLAVCFFVVGRNLRICSFLACVYRVMDALGKFGEHSKSWSYYRLRLELLLRIFRALQTSRVRTLGMNKFESFVQLQKDRHTDSLMRGILTDREHRTKRKR